MTPASNSPRTAVWPSRSTPSPAAFAANQTRTRPSNNSRNSMLATDTWPGIPHQSHGLPPSGQRRSFAIATNTHATSSIRPSDHEAFVAVRDLHWPVLHEGNLLVGTRSRRQGCENERRRTVLGRLFGGRSRIAERARQAAYDRMPKRRDIPWRWHAVRDITTQLRHRHGLHSGSGQADSHRRAEAGHISALDRVSRLEHECPGHLGARQVQGNVDEDCEEEESAPPHICDSNLPTRSTRCERRRLVPQRQGRWPVQMS